MTCQPHENYHIKTDGTRIEIVFCLDYNDAYITDIVKLIYRATGESIRGFNIMYKNNTTNP